MSTLLHLLLPLGFLLSTDSGGVVGLAVALLLIVSVAAVAAVRHQSGAAPALVGDLVTASRRLHGSFRRLSQPGSPGRPQPRAPGVTLPA